MSQLLDFSSILSRKNFLSGFLPDQNRFGIFAFLSKYSTKIKWLIISIAVIFQSLCIVAKFTKVEMTLCIPEKNLKTY